MKPSDRLRALDARARQRGRPGLAIRPVGALALLCVGVAVGFWVHYAWAAGWYSCYARLVW